jgi:hypothetical protein
LGTENAKAGIKVLASSNRLVLFIMSLSREQVRPAILETFPGISQRSRTAKPW